MVPLLYSIFFIFCVYFSYQDIRYGELNRLQVWTATILIAGIRGIADVTGTLLGVCAGLLVFVFELTPNFRTV